MTHSFFRSAGIALVCILCTLFVPSANGQIRSSLTTLSDGNGNPLMAKKASAGDNAYLFSKDYQDGVLFLEGNTKGIGGSKFKLNLQTSRLYYMDGNGSEMEVASIIKRIEFEQAVFEKGFPAVDKLTPDHFYQVLSEGKALLLMSTRFEEIEYKEFNSASVVKRTDKLQTYYGVMGNRISKLAKAEDVLLLLSDKTKQVSDFMKHENSKVKKQEDLEKIFHYYNSL